MAKASDYSDRSRAPREVELQPWWQPFDVTTLLRVTKDLSRQPTLERGWGQPPLLIPGDPGSGQEPRYWSQVTLSNPHRAALPFGVDSGFPAMQKNLEPGMREADAKDPGAPTPCAPPTTPPSRSAEDTCGVAAPASPLDHPGESQSPQVGGVWMLSPPEASAGASKKQCATSAACARAAPKPWVRSQESNLCFGQ